MLTGWRLLDLSSRLPGPLCSLILLDLGMEVIRVEPPEGLGKGDIFREFPEEKTPYFPMLNRGKKSVTLNLKSEKGRHLFLEMAKRADVVLEGFRPGVMDRLEIGWPRLRQVNPRLILASISGYGQEGTYRNTAGHDLNYLAQTGILSLNASSERESPVCPPIQIADVGGGTYPAVIGILAALMERSRTDRGRWLDISMVDGSLFLMGMAMFDYGIGKQIAPGSPPIARGAANYHVYETKDGRFVALGALEENFWNAFCDAVHHPEWKSFYGDEAAMCSETLLEEMKKLFRTKTRDEWDNDLQKWDVCFSPVRTIEEVEEDSYLKERGIFRWIASPNGKRFPALRFPLAGRDVIDKKREVPRLGQHNEVFLKKELGIEDAEFETFRREGVI